MRKLLLTMLCLSTSYFFGDTNASLFSVMTNMSEAPKSPPILDLPSLEVVSSIITSSNSLDDINNEFTVEEYNGSNIFYPPEAFVGVWWRFYTQTTTLFKLPAVSEEILVINKESTALWLQDVKTSNVVRSTSKRKLVVSYFDLFDHYFFVFHYTNQDPTSQAIRDQQGFFVRVLSDSSYMQMSTSPNFEPEKSMYWRRFPKANINLAISNK